MSHQVISLKYRPQRFEDVIGQEHITITLKNAIEKNRLGHAYIFSGPRGTGKTTTARLLAKMVNCENPKDGNPCNECVSCREITEGRSLDVLEIDGASNRGIDSIRDLREQVKYPPTHGKYKVYIIDEFHQITKDAFNALLKTLEEPPRHILFIFATTELHKVLPTILSRCQRFEFKRIPLVQVMDLLKNIAAAEGIEIDDDSLLLIAKKGDGSIRDSESILEQVIAFSNERISYESILGILGVIREEVYFSMFNALVTAQADKALEIIDDMLMYGYDLAEFVTMFSIFLRDLYMVKAHGSADILNTTETLKKEYAELAQSQESHTLIRMLAIVNDELSNISRSSNTKILVETLFIKLSNLQDLQQLDDVISELKHQVPAPVRPAAPKVLAKPEVPVQPVKPKPVEQVAEPASNGYASPILNGHFKSKPVALEPSAPQIPQLELAEQKTSEEPRQMNQKTTVSLTIEQIKEKWQNVIDCVQPQKPMVAALLLNIGLVGLKGNILEINAEDEYSASTIKVEERFIIDCMNKIYGTVLTLNISLSKVADNQRVIKKKEIDSAAKLILQSFDGELL